MVSKPVFALMISTLLVIGLAYASIAADYYVDANSGDDSNDGSEESPWLTITHALDSVTGTEAEPVTIHVAAGTYSISTNGETFPLNMKSWVSLSGEDRDTTILDAEDTAYHVIHCNGADNLAIEGLTITGGNANGSDLDDCGAGIFCSGTSPAISNNIITGNHASLAGGAIECRNSGALVESNTISQNSAMDAGAIHFYHGSPTLRGNSLTNNTATRYGGAIEWYDSSGSSQNNLIAGNTASSNGGGIHVCGSSVTFTNNTVVNNSASSGGGAYCEGAGSTTVKDSILWANSSDQVYVDGGTVTITYSCIQDWTGGGTGNISDDPLFITGPDGDYYLSQTAAGQGADSPCVDVGSDTAANLGLDGRTTRSDGVFDTGTVDIGYHYPISTGENNPPNEPSNPFPEDGATDQSTSLTLAWDGGDPDSADTVTYDVYFGESEEPPLAYEGLTQTSVPVSGLTAGADYHWRVVAEDSHGAVTEGPVWSFMTGGSAPDVSIRLESASFLSDTVLSGHTAIFVEVEKGEESVTEVQVGITTGRATEWYPAVQDKYLTIRWKWIFDTESVTGGVDGELGLQARALGGEEVLAQTDAITVTVHNDGVIDSGFTVGLDGFPHGNSQSPPKCLGMAGYSKWLYEQSGGSGWNADFLHLWDAHASASESDSIGIQAHNTMDWLWGHWYTFITIFGGDDVSDTLDELRASLVTSGPQIVGLVKPNLIINADCHAVLAYALDEGNDRILVYDPNSEFIFGEIEYNADKSGFVPYKSPGAGSSGPAYSHFRLVPASKLYADSDFRLNAGQPVNRVVVEDDSVCLVMDDIDTIPLTISLRSQNPESTNVDVFATFDERPDPDYPTECDFHSTGSTGNETISIDRTGNRLFVVAKCISGSARINLYAYTTVGPGLALNMTGTSAGSRKGDDTDYRDSNFTYCPGDTVTVNLAVVNPGDAEMVDVFVALMTPEGGLLYWPALWYEQRPFYSGLLASDLSIEEYSLLELRLPEGLATGTYCWYAAIAQQGTFDFLSTIASEPFEIGE